MAWLPSSAPIFNWPPATLGDPAILASCCSVIECKRAPPAGGAPKLRRSAAQRPMPNNHSRRCRYDERVGTTVGSGEGRRMGRWGERAEMELLKRMLYSSGDLAAVRHDNRCTVGRAKARAYPASEGCVCRPQRGGVFSSRRRIRLFRQWRLFFREVQAVEHAVGHQQR